MALFVVVLLWHVGVVTGLAGCHGDRDKDDRPRQNCTAAGFREVPRGLETSTKVGEEPQVVGREAAVADVQPKHK